MLMPTPMPGVVQQLLLYFCTGEIKNDTGRGEGGGGAELRAGSSKVWTDRS